MKKDKKRLLMMGLVLFLITAGVLLFGIAIFSKEEITVTNLLPSAIILLLIIITSVILFKRYNDVKKGMPLEDERSRKVMNMASSRAFYVTLYWLLIISFFEEFFAGVVGQETLDAGQTVGGGIMGMTIAFIAFWIYYNRKGNLG